MEEEYELDDFGAPILDDFGAPKLKDKRASNQKVADAFSVGKFAPKKEQLSPIQTAIAEQNQISPIPTEELEKRENPRDAGFWESFYKKGKSFITNTIPQTLETTALLDESPTLKELKTSRGVTTYDKFGVIPSDEDFNDPETLYTKAKVAADRANKGFLNAEEKELANKSLEILEDVKKKVPDADPEFIRDYFKVKYDQYLGKKSTERMGKINVQKQEAKEALKGVPQEFSDVEGVGSALGLAGGVIGEGIMQIPLAVATKGASSFVQERAGIYDEALETKANFLSEKYGTKVTPEMVRTLGEDGDVQLLANQFGLISGALDMMSANQVASPITKKLAINKIKDELLKRNTSKGLQILGDVSKGTASEASTGFIQDLNSQIASKMSTGVSFGDAIATADYGRALEAAGMEAIGGFGVGGGINATSAAKNALSQINSDLETISSGDPALDLQQDIEAQKVIDEITQSKDAISQQTTGEVPVQPETQISPEVPQGIPQTEPQAVAQEEVQVVEPTTEFIPSQETTVKGDIRESIRPSAPEVVSDEYSLLKKRLKDEARGAREGFKAGVKTAKTAAKDLDLMKKVLRSSLSDMVRSSFKGLSIPQKTLESVIGKIGKIDVMSDSQIDKLNTFIDNAVKDSQYTEKLTTANTLRKAVKGRIKTATTGNETADVRRFYQIKPENLNSEQLAQYTEIANALNADVPDVRPLRATFDSLVEANELAETGFTKTSSPEQVLASIGAVEDVTDYESFVNAKRRLSAARTKFAKMGEDGTIEDDQMELYSNQLDAVQSALDEATTKFSKEAEAFKKQRIAESKQVLQSIESFPNKEVQQYVDRFTSVSKDQLEKMSPAGVESYFQIAEGLADGFYNKELFDFVAKAKRQENTEKLLNIGESVKKEVNKRRKFLGLFKTNLNPLKDHAKLLKNFLLQHANNWDKILLQGKDRPIYNALFDPIFAQIDKLTKADNKILSDYYDVSRDVKEAQRIKIGMIMDQLDWQSNRQENQPVDKMRYLLNQDPAFPDPNAATDAKTKLNEAFDIYVEQYGKLPKDASGNVDVASALSSLNPKEQKLLKTTQELFKSLRDRAEASTVMMGGEYRDRDNYFFNIIKQKVREGKDADVEMTSAKAVESMLSNAENLKTRAGSTYLRSGTPYFIELDVDKVASKYVKDINRNYFLTPVVRENISAISDAAKKSEGEIRTMFDQMYEAAKDRVISTYAFNTKGIAGFDRFLDSLLTGMRNLQLARPDRVVIEGMSNIARVAGMYNGISPNSTHPGFVMVMQDTNSSVLPNLGNYAEEYAAPDIHGSKTSKKLAELTSDIIAFADAKVRKIAYGTIFNQEFKNLTGKDFSPASYQESQAYRDSVGGVIGEVSTKTDALVSDLLSSTNRLNAPSKTRITPWTDLIDTKSKGAKLLGYMQSFATAENATFMHSLRDIAYGTNEGRAVGAKRISSLLVSNYIYSTFNYMVYSAIKAALDDEEEVEDAILKPFTEQGITNSALASVASLLTGRYGNVLRPVIMAAIAIISESAKGNPEEEATAKKITEVMNAAMFTGSRAINLRYERPENFVNIIPAVGPLIGDAIGTTLAVTDMMKDFEEMDDREKAYYNLGSLVNSIIALRMPNPASPIVKKWLDAEIRQMNKKSKGTSAPSPLLPNLPNIPMNQPVMAQPLIQQPQIPVIR